MIPLTAGEISKIVDGELFAPSDLLVTQAPSFDSRTVEPGSIFLALKGEHADGHDFARQAMENGASLVFSNRKMDVDCIVVENVIAALGALAHFVRQRLDSMTVIGVTGSHGKTTTKDLLAWVLSLQGETVASLGSFNNELGVPITLLRCTESTRYCVVEMGARHVGDIENLCQIAEPDIGVVLEVGSAHSGEFGSREAIALAKSEIVHNLREGGTAVLGRYDELTPKMADGLNLTVLTFGQTHEAQVRATDVDIREGRAHFDLVTPEGRAAVALRLIGAHQIPNALAAASVCTALHIPLDVIAGGLSTAEMRSKWRMELHELNDLLLINDAYNANPESTAAALRTLSFFAQERGGQSWAFLGKMHELGASSKRDHAEIGSLAQSLGIDHLVCVNEPDYGSSMPVNAREMVVHYSKNKAEALSMAEHFSPGDVVLVKASRAERMEELAEGLIIRWEQLRAIENKKVSD
ncbi:MAG: UDP-N-acetylmuramoyl-tripeptide--D-alanyl-D-alanine ligase [Candidatus Nanopelagicaceae bacterium]